MPGFTYSPTMLGQQITLIMKSGNKVKGEVREANPVEVVLKVPGTKVLGIDLIQRNIETAKAIFCRDNITYVYGDALKNLRL